MKRASNASAEPTVTGDRFADALRVDGNAAAGILSELFVPDLTSARAKCGGCGMTRTIGSIRQVPPPSLLRGTPTELVTDHDR
jgi:hypothetical protein